MWLDANNQDLIYTLSVLYIQQQKFAKAKPYVVKLGEIYPESSQIREMMNIIKQGMQKWLSSKQLVKKFLSAFALIHV